MITECPHCYTRFELKTNICPSCKKDTNDKTNTNPDMTALTVKEDQTFPNVCFLCADKSADILSFNPSHNYEKPYWKELSLSELIAMIFSAIFGVFGFVIYQPKNTEISYKINLPVCATCKDQKPEVNILNTIYSSKSISIAVHKKFKQSFTKHNEKYEWQNT